LSPISTWQTGNRSHQVGAVVLVKIPIVAIDSPGVRSGRMLGTRFVGIVVPEPGSPSIAHRSRRHSDYFVAAFGE
jgi:hypothetical protein